MSVSDAGLSLPTSGVHAVLLVDDDLGPREVVSRMLARLGFVLETAPSGAAALQRLEEHNGKFDAIVTDYQMPGMSGRELLEHVRLRDAFLPMVMLSGGTPDEALAHALERLHAAFLMKPFTAQALAAAIRLQITSEAERRRADLVERR